MGFGEVVLGLASVALGVHQLHKGVRRLSGEYRGGQRLDGITAPRVIGTQGLEMPGRPFMDSGRLPVAGHAPMRMRSFNIRTLDDRIRYLQRLSDEGKRDPQVYAFARKALSGKCGNGWCIPEKDNLSEAKALFGAIRRQVPTRRSRNDIATARKLFNNVRQNVRYTSDIEGVDTYQKPSHTLGLRTGDCDDYSTLTCAALGSVGIPCRYKVIRTKGARDWNHIYPQAGFPRANPQRWISMDSSVNMPFGWEAPKRMVAASKVFRVR
jgi:transglutaminase-like putative cysteine protease